MTCKLTSGAEAGHTAIYLENDLIRITVLPEKGADIYAFVHKPSGLDVLWKNPVGLWPPGSPPHDGSGDTGFLHNYEGCWQELFPSCNGPTTYQGQTMPMHGEVALLPWQYRIETHTADELAVHFQVETRLTSFRLERTMRLARDAMQLTLDEKVTNIGNAEQHFAWGHHCVVGGPWLEAGCQLQAPAGTIHTLDQVYEETAQLAPGQKEPWPYARTRSGERLDLRVVPGPEAHRHDDALLSDLTDGWVSVTNPRLNFSFSLHWDLAIFKWIMIWQVYGGAEALPFKGQAYALGIEPWTNGEPLGEAVAAGAARRLQPGESFATRLEARIS